MTCDEILKRYPHASPSFVARNRDDHTAGIHSKEVRQHRVKALVPSDEGKQAISGSFEQGTRYHIRFTVYACQPRDWSNLSASIKCLEDALVRAGWLPDDNWKVLTGEAIPAKAKTKAEQRTVIEITRTI